ncbi:hypothetical protein Tco_0649390, partial [Tanacetum coccineum]
VEGRSSQPCFWDGGKTCASLRRTIPEGSLVLGVTPPDGAWTEHVSGGVT